MAISTRINISDIKTSLILMLIFMIFSPYLSQMVFCENEGGPCLNDNDNPHVDGSTICKQLYKTQKLLAIDEEGEEIVKLDILFSSVISEITVYRK